MRHALAAALLVLIFANSPARAEGTMFGGTLSGGRILRVETVYPYVEVGYHIKVGSSLEITPNVSFFYGNPMAVDVPVLGNALGFELRWQLLQKGKFGLSFLWDFKLMLVYWRSFGIGIQIGTPSVVMNYRIIPRFALVFGYLMPIGLMINTQRHPTDRLFQTNFYAAIPIAFRIGGEVSATSSIFVNFTIDVGPDIIPRNDFPTILRAYLIARIGVGFRI